MPSTRPTLSSIFQSHRRVDTRVVQPNSSASKAIEELIREWCNQIPVLGFSYGHYDLRLIRHYFVTQLSQGADVTVAEEGNSIMFLSTPKYVCGPHELLGAGDKLRQMGEDVRGQAAEVLVSVRVARQGEKVGVTRLTALLALVFKAEGRAGAKP